MQNTKDTNYYRTILEQVRSAYGEEHDYEAAMATLYLWVGDKIRTRPDNRPGIEIHIDQRWWLDNVFIASRFEGSKVIHIHWADVEWALTRISRRRHSNV